MAQEISHEGGYGTPVTRPAVRSTTEWAAGGSLIEAVLGIAAVVLAILGLVGVRAETLASIATIVLGVAFVFAGVALASRYTTLLTETSGGRLESTAFGGGLGLEVLAGFAGIVLGILALIGTHSLTLMAAAAIALGLTLLFSSGSFSRLSALEISRAGVGDEARTVAHEAVMATNGLEMLAGIGVAALGVLALVGIAQLSLILVALLALGGVLLFAGSVFGGRLLSMLQ